jgi:hypothetical protein
MVSEEENWELFDAGDVRSHMSQRKQKLSFAPKILAMDFDRGSF